MGHVLTGEIHFFVAVRCPGKFIFSCFCRHSHPDTPTKFVFQSFKEGIFERGLEGWTNIVAKTSPPKIKVTCVFNEVFFLTEAQVNITITMPIFLVR